MSTGRIILKNEKIKYSLYDRVWAAGISKFGNLRFFEDGFGTPAELKLLKNKIEFCKSRDPSIFIQQCKNTIKIKSYRIITYIDYNL